jgi:hypothetical protein
LQVLNTRPKRGGILRRQVLYKEHQRYQDGTCAADSMLHGKTTVYTSFQAERTVLNTHCR